MTSLRSIWHSAFGIAALVCLVGCNSGSGGVDGRSRLPSSQHYAITGTVTERDEIHSQLTIAHDTVSGLMPAMTMPFRVANLNPAVQPGDRVKGTLVVTADGGWIEGMVITHKSEHPLSPPPQPTQSGVGAPVPDFAFENQDGKRIHLADFRGRAVLLTFIYTRCPFPDFCPLMMKNFNAVRHALATKPDLERRVHMLSISIDPDYDTLPELHAYGKKMIPGADPFAHWDLVTASPDEIRRTAEWFGLTYREESGQITHSLVTAIIDPGGRLVRILPSNSWKPEDAIAALTDIRQ